MNRLILIVIIGIFITGAVIAQDKKAAASTDSQTSSKQILFRIPFELYGGHIYLQVRVSNSAPHTFLLDSGAQIAHIRVELAQTLNLKLGSEIGVTGIGPGRIKANYIKGIAFNVAGAEFADAQALALPSAEFFEPLESGFGRSFDGILGYDFFNRFVVEVDYANQIINLYDPRSYHYEGSGETIPIRILDKKPYISATLAPVEGVPIESNLHVDLGYGGGLSFNGNFVEENQLVKSARTIIESFTRGAGGETTARIGRLKSLQFGRFLLPSPIAAFSLVQGRGVRSDSSGRIGGMYLQRFKVVLDYSRKQLYLEPNANFDDLFETDMSGIALTSDPPDYQTFVIYKIVPGSPAAEAKLQTGDIITGIDAKPATEFNLEKIREIFRRNGTQHNLKIKRGSETLKIQIKLRRLI